MNNNKFIISFYPGSSGRFLAVLVHRLINQSEDPIIISKNNSAHENTYYVGHGMYDPNFNIYERLIWHDNINHKHYILPEYKLNRLFLICTHCFPFNSSENINEDVAKSTIILLRLTIDDVKEITFNGLYKNSENSEIVVSKKALELFVKINNKFKEKNSLNWFIEKKSNFNNVIEISYQSMFEKENDNYKLLNILQYITGIENIPKSCYIALETYIKNRNELVQKYNLR